MRLGNKEEFVLTAQLKWDCRNRYSEPWLEPFHIAAAASLKEGSRILDIGAGRRPAIPLEGRPPACHYVGFDTSRVELEQAPSHSYDEIIIADVMDPIPELSGQFDLVVSWQVMEHVKRLEVALENMRSFLRPGGRLVAHLSGRFSAFAILNQVVHHRLAVEAMRRLLDRDPQTVFPAYYHKCWYGALERVLSSWAAFEIRCRYRGASYFDFSPLLRQAYLLYEDWVCSHRLKNLATHYLIAAVK